MTRSCFLFILGFIIMQINVGAQHELIFMIRCKALLNCDKDSIVIIFMKITHFAHFIKYFIKFQFMKCHHFFVDIGIKCIKSSETGEWPH